MLKSDTFREQHKKALELMKLIQDRLSPAQVAADPQGVAMNLAKLSGVVNVHLSMEDKSLYPALMNHSNPLVKKSAEKFVKEMGGIASGFAAYYRKWNAMTIGAAPDLFIKETKAIIATLSDRIQREEAELYPLADNA
ncbi:MAG: hypothetical protein A2V88_12640 [Elusimicrobia bacterium RBG_16_66_12]|nr:MAG: hypothetical protein A2V88_12640 [Elusimicrobia bacterium RBG_16_66_12]